MRLQQIPSNSMIPIPRPKARKAGIVVGLVSAVMIPLVGNALLQQNPPRNLPEFLNRLPDANDQARMRQQQSVEQNFEAANAYRKKQIAEDSAKLLKLAAELKTEVDKTNKDTLSLSVIRKADAIEKLARDVKEKMKLTVGPN
jgi:hypothetical protein